MTCHGIRPNVRRFGILHLISIVTISPQSTCHSAPVSEILSKSDHPQQKKMASCRFSRWRIQAILDFRGPIMGSLKSPCTTSYRSSIETIALNCLVFEKIALLPRHAMHKRGLCRHAVYVCVSVCPCVRMSVTFMSCVKTNKDIFEIFSLSGSHTILVFPYQTGWRYSDGNPRNGGVECRWGRQKSLF